MIITRWYCGRCSKYDELFVSSTVDIGVIKFIMLLCRVGPLRKAEEEKVRAERAAAVAGFRSLLSEKGEISSTSRWSKVV